jgi:hypothetical protein
MQPRDSSILHAVGFALGLLSSQAVAVAPSAPSQSSQVMRPHQLSIPEYRYEFNPNQLQAFTFLPYDQNSQAQKLQDLLPSTSQKAFALYCTLAYPTIPYRIGHPFSVESVFLFEHFSDDKIHFQKLNAMLELEPKALREPLHESLIRYGLLWVEGSSEAYVRLNNQGKFDKNATLQKLRTAVPCPN